MPTRPRPGPRCDAGRRDDRERLLELLTHQQRVAQAGLMTAGLTHDINNHLQLILGAASLALEDDDPHAWRDALERIQEQSFAVSEMTRSFLAFVRKRDPTESAVFQAREVVVQSVRLVRPLADRCRVELAAGTVAEAAVRGELRLAIQAVVNLASNAIQACAEGAGKVTLSSRRIGLDRIRIEVKDDGPGIPESIRWRIFRPFASGRAEGEGTGLGLFVVRQIVRKFKGSIRVRTTPRGTTMEIDLPVAESMSG